MRLTMIGVAAAIGVLAARDSQAAVTGCKAKVDGKTGAIEVSGSGITGTPAWGPSADSTPFAFYDVGSCQTGDTLKECTLADPASNAARTAPAGCAVYVGDTSGDPPCVAFIKKGCTVLAGGTDGVTVITQERALIGGITAADTPGFPVTLSQPGSYRLASNLDVRGEPSAENVTAIDVTADDVAIDLNGFAILGPGATVPVVGSGDGVQGNGRFRLVVRNGRISGMGGDGIDIFGSSNQAPQVRDVVAGNNGGVGIRVGSGALVADCTAVGNAVGIGADIAVVRDSMAHQNSGSGISASWSTVSGCTAYSNGGNGIRVTSSTVTGCKVRDSGSAGIDGTTAGPNLITGNTVTNSFSGGDLKLNIRDGYSNNALGTGGVTGGVALGDNLCNGTLCP